MALRRRVLSTFPLIQQQHGIIHNTPVLVPKHVKPFMLQVKSLPRTFKDLGAVQDHLGARGVSCYVDKHKTTAIAKLTDPIHNARGWLMFYDFGVWVRVVDDADAEEINEKMDALDRSMGTYSQECIEDYKIIVDRHEKKLQEKHAHAFNDHIILKTFDLDALKIICHVLAYSAALKESRVKVEHLFESFERFFDNHTRPSESSIRDWLFPKKERVELMMYMQELNSFHLQFHKQFELLEWSETAWEYTQYHDIQDTMVREFETRRRYKELTQRMDFMHSNFKNFFEIGTTLEGALSEKMIVYLFAMELTLTVYDIFIK